MKTLFYPKLAVNGMKKNKRLYLPYILTLVAMVMMMYITAYLARSENIANTNRGVYAQWCLWLGIIVIGIFSLIFLFYSYFVLIKNRGKEFGLYNILGMNKRNIARILLCESLFTLIISLLCGLAAGILLSRLAELCMFRLLGIEPVGNLSVDAGAIAISIHSHNDNSSAERLCPHRQTKRNQSASKRKAGRKTATGKFRIRLSRLDTACYRLLYRRHNTGGH